MMRAISFVLIVLISWTMPVAHAAKKKITAPVAASEVVKAAKAKVAKKAPQKRKKSVHKWLNPPPPCSDVVCLARIILGETGLEDRKSRLAVAYVAWKYRHEQGRSMFDELYSGRYSFIYCKECFKTVIATRGEHWSLAMAQARHIVRIYPVPPDKRIAEAKNYVRWEHATPKGARWLRENTCPLTKDGTRVMVGKHEFRKECVKTDTEKLLANAVPTPSPKTPLRKKPKATFVLSKPTLSPPTPLRMKPNDLIARAILKNVPATKYR